MLGIFGSTAAEPLGILLIMPIAGVAVLTGFVTVWIGYHMREAPADGSPLFAAEARSA